MYSPTSARNIAILKALTKSGIDDVTFIKVQVRDGFDEVRIDSQKAYTTAISNNSIMLNTLRFAEPGVVGVYGKAIVETGMPVAKKVNRVRRNGVIAHVPHTISTKKK
jgi:poly(3-hydroxybutyrate) depolymerase